jgi:DNA-binding MarR family transcriptional regulator
MGLFAEAFTGLAAQFNAHFAQHDLDPVEFEVLIRLFRTPGGRLRMTDLSAQTSLTTSGVTRVVDRLERDGLVQREACPTDRRSSYAVIASAGRDRLAQVLPEHLALIDEWLIGRLTAEQLDALLVALRVIRNAVRPCATAGADEAVAATQ